VLMIIIGPMRDEVVHVYELEEKCIMRTFINFTLRQV
jgi:hypothetical protein